MIKKKIISIIGGRPHIIKVASIHEAIKSTGINHILLDLGTFRKKFGPKTYRELSLPRPDIIIEPFEIDIIPYLDYLKHISITLRNIFLNSDPDYVLVYGDIDPSVAASIASVSLGVPLIHVEAGLRNYDFDDTEEVNRIIIDKFSSFLLANSDFARQNLLREGHFDKNIFIIGNTVIDSLKRHIHLADKNIINSLPVKLGEYGIMTIHRDENINSSLRLQRILGGIFEISRDIPLVFIQYRSTRDSFRRHKIQSEITNLNNLFITETLSYHEYLGLLKNSKFIISDSSGIQDEAVYLGKPCLICRDATHRLDNNKYPFVQIVGTDPKAISNAVKQILSEPSQLDRKYPGDWDLDVGEQVSRILLKHL